MEAKDPLSHLIILEGGKDGYLVKTVEVLNYIYIYIGRYSRSPREDAFPH